VSMITGSGLAAAGGGAASARMCATMADSSA